MKPHIHKKYFEIWADEQSQNLILKYFLLFTIIIISFLATSIIILSNKNPLIVSVDKNRSKVISVSKESKLFIKEEIKRAISLFINIKQNFNYKTIDKNLYISSKFILPEKKKEFLMANNNHQKIVKKKKIIQKFYISSPILIDIKNRQAKVAGDRILIVDGLRATKPMTFKINYQFGKRTEHNPEGVYITSEELISTLEH